MSASTDHVMPATSVHGSGEATPQRKLLHLLNELTKWTVSMTALGVLLWRRDLAVAWALLGSILNVGVCKVLKKLINEQRPASARKSDPGMPSSHAQSLAYLAVYTAISVGAAWGAEKPLLAKGLSIAVLGLGAFMSWLRVASGYHSSAQVLVGVALGSVIAAAWQAWGAAYWLPLAVTKPLVGKVIVAIMMIGTGAFAVKTLAGAGKDVDRLRLALK